MKLTNTLRDLLGEHVPAGTTVHSTGVVELHPTDPRATVCGHCGRGWDDTVGTEWTPVPSARCPFEYDHEYSDDEGSEQ